VIDIEDNQAFLSHLESLDIKVSTEGHRLKIDAPKGRLSDEMRALLKARKPELLEFFKNNTFIEQKSDGYLPIKPTSRTDKLYASFAQQRLWFLDQLAENKSATYNLPLFLRASGDLHTSSLVQAINEIIRRHEVLRTVFQAPEMDDKEPYQHILPALVLNVPMIDLSQLDTQQREQQIQSIAHKESEHLFDLSKGPLVRLSIIKTKAKNSVLLFHFHHTVFDGLSIAIFLREIKLLYSSFLQGEPSPLAPLKIQYADYSQWQRKTLSGKALEKHLEYWKTHLEGAPPFIELPKDHPRSVDHPPKGARISFEIDQELTENLRSLSKQNNATLFMTLYAAFAVFLARHTGEDDLVIGMPVANRNHQQLEPLIGYFANTLALRFHVTQELTFADFLQQAKATVLAALQHQNIPFEKLIDELKIEKTLTHNPLFQVMFTFQEAYLEDFTLPGLTLSPLLFDQTNAKFDLSLMVREHKNKLVCIFEYSAKLFDAPTIKRMVTRFQNLIQGIVDQPLEKISHLPLLTESEEHWLLVDFNQSSRVLPKNKYVHQLFEAQVKSRPDQLAIVFNNEKMTYQELNTKANQLAHYLIALGVKAETRVAICVERSFDILIGILGILKAGGAYIPLDPNYPEQRLQFMLQDSDCAVLISQNHLLDKFPPKHLKQIICLDSDSNKIATFVNTNPTGRHKPQDLAYVIYTSGSTGKPKGVMITHHNLSSSYYAYCAAYPLSEIVSHLQMANYAFAVFTGDWVKALCSGNKLVLCPSELLSAPDQLYPLMVREQIEYAEFVPAVIRQLTEYLQQSHQRLDFMKCCIIASDTCYMKEFREFKALCSRSTQVVSSYGATEVTSDSTYIDNITTPLPDDAVVPVGKPLANTKIYILDIHHNVVPIGVSGEIYIAGAGVARGYLNRPELTAQRFLTIDLSGESHYVYKTGDAARSLADGNLEFLGRLDNQVKLRGIRIELGEIEAVLLRHQSVKEAIVVLHEKGDNAYLAAYVTLEESLENVAYTLRAWLETRIPSYMLPAFFVPLETLPLTPNGKVNRKALPEPEIRHTQSRFVAPRDSLELRLVLLWEKILDISPVSITDNFFEIGGDSLLSIRLISTIHTEFGVRIPLHMIFQNATVEQLASILRQDGVTSDWSPLVCLQSHGSKAPLFCVHAAGGIVFRYIQTAALLGTERPFYGIQARGIEPGDEVYGSIEEMAKNYVKAIRTIQSKGPYLLSGWSFGGTVAFEMARLLEQAGETVPYLLMIDAPSPFVDTYEKDEVEFLLERLRSAAGLALDDVYQQDSREARMLYLFQEQKLAGLFAADMDINDAELRLKIHMHHNKIMCQYRPAGSFNGKIIFFKPTEKIPFDTEMKDPIPAWQPFANGGIEVHETPGNHFNMFSPVNSPVLAKKMKACIESTGL